MKWTLKTMTRLLLLCMLLALTACGGGGNDTEELVVINLSLVGSSTATVGSVQFDLILPDGFALPADNAGNLDAGVLAQVVTDSTVAAYYQPETTTEHGVLSMGLIKADSAGFSPGKLVTFTRVLNIDEALPIIAEFVVENLEVSDGSTLLSGFTISISIEKQTNVL